MDNNKDDALWMNYPGAVTKKAEQPLYDGNGEPWNEAAEKAEQARYQASQSQAAQPTGQDWDRYATGVLPWSFRIAPNQSLEVIADAMQKELNDLRQLLAAHIAGTSQATKAQAEPGEWRTFLEMWTHDGALQTFSNRQKFRNAAFALLAAPVAKEAPAVPEGWKLVPAAPTETMRMACKHWAYSDHIDEDWAAMLAAAPIASVAKEATRDAESVQTFAQRLYGPTPSNAERRDALYTMALIFAASETDSARDANFEEMWREFLAVPRIAIFDSLTRHTGLEISTNYTFETEEFFEVEAVERILAVKASTRNPCRCANIGECDGSCAPYIGEQVASGAPTEVEALKLKYGMMKTAYEAELSILRQRTSIPALVNSFLGWALPISLAANFPGIEQPIGTHLMSADEAKAMFEYVLARRFRAPGNAGGDTPKDAWDAAKEMAARRIEADCLGFKEDDAQLDKLAADIRAMPYREPAGTESGSDIATTTSTVSAPAVQNPYNGYLSHYWQAGYDGDEIDATTRGAALGAYSEGIKARTEGAQKAPEEVRNQALKFADQIITDMFEGGDLDGGTVQDMAVARGLLVPKEMPGPCGEDGSCQCAQNDAEFPTTCYRKTYLPELRALRTSSTDQANADTRSAE